MTRILTTIAIALTTILAWAQPNFDQPHGLYTGTSLTVSISPAASEIHYTLDGSTPTAASPRYTKPL